MTPFRCNPLWNLELDFPSGFNLINNIIITTATTAPHPPRPAKNTTKRKTYVKTKRRLIQNNRNPMIAWGENNRRNNTKMMTTGIWKQWCYYIETRAEQQQQQQQKRRARWDGAQSLPKRKHDKIESKQLSDLKHKPVKAMIMKSKETRQEKLRSTMPETRNLDPRRLMWNTTKHCSCSSKEGDCPKNRVRWRKIEENKHGETLGFRFLFLFF